MAQGELEKLKALIDSDSAILTAWPLRRRQAAAQALAAFAAERQIDLSPEEIESLFSARSAPAAEAERWTTRRWTSYPAAARLIASSPRAATASSPVRVADQATAVLCAGSPAEQGCRSLFSRGISRTPATGALT